MFTRIFQHLLPDSRAWRITAEKTLRRLFAGLSGLGTDTRGFIDGVWSDVQPQSTREVALFEEQFGLPNTVTNMQSRRDRLEARWRATGGQDPRYIQDTLQAAGFDVYVHEWWVPGTEPPLGVQAAATARDPNTYLGDGMMATQFYSCDGAADMQDGDTVAQDGSSFGPAGYALVNKLIVPATTVIGDGAFEMFDGGPEAMDGGLQIAFGEKQYAIPADPAVFPYFLYIGAAVFPNKAAVPSSRKNEFEQLCLKICPAQLWLGILVEYG